MVAVLAGAALLIVLFGASVVAQQRSGDGDAGQRPGGLVGTLGELVEPLPEVAAAGLSAVCRRPDGRLVFRGTCTVRVTPSDERLRTLRLRARAATTVVSPAPGGDVVVRVDLAANEEVPLAIGAEGGNVELTCGAGTCIVEVV